MKKKWLEILFKESFKSFSLVIKIAIICFFLGIILSISAFFVIKSSNTQFDEEKISVYLPSGVDYHQLIDSLSPHLKSVKTFTLTSKMMTFRVRSGRYVISKGMSNYDIIKVFRKMSQPVRVTFNNIENIMTLAGQIAKYIEADSLSLHHVFLDSDFLFKNGFNRSSALAMYIPNSYQFFWNTSAETFRNRILAEYRHFWNKTRLAKADSLGLSKIDIITLASIVQKESNQLDEYSTLAGVYINRIKKNIPLQADPTVVYAMKKKANDFDLVIRRVLYKDLKIDSPYNTYLYKGVPPGPIITPDISTIDAVLNYKKHDYIFFIADINHIGYHLFARTLQEHLKNKKHYVRWLNKRKIRR